MKNSPTSSPNCPSSPSTRLRRLLEAGRLAEACRRDPNTRVIGPTVADYGIGAGSTGTRADLLVCDDVVDVRALHSRIDRCRVAEYFENNLMNLLEPEGRFWGLFTPWHADDLNARLKKNAAFALFRQPIGPDFEPIWSAKWHRERLQARKIEIGSASFAPAYLLECREPRIWIMGA